MQATNPEQQCTSDKATRKSTSKDIKECKFKGKCAIPGCQMRHDCLLGDECKRRNCPLRHPQKKLDKCKRKWGDSCSEGSNNDSTKSDKSDKSDDEFELVAATDANVDTSEVQPPSNKPNQGIATNYVTAIVGMLSVFAKNVPDPQQAKNVPDPQDKLPDEGKVPPTHIDCAVPPTSLSQTVTDYSSESDEVAGQEPGNDEKETEWSCQLCTLRNPINIDTCGACTSQRIVRPSKEGAVIARTPLDMDTDPDNNQSNNNLVDDEVPNPSEGEDDSGRRCPICTLMNEVTAKQCGACESPLFIDDGIKLTEGFDDDKSQSVEDSTWHCAICTLSNLGTDKTCSLCKAERPPVCGSPHADNEEKPSQVPAQPVDNNLRTVTDSGNSGSPILADADSDWQCINCTLVNLSSDSRCSVCNVERPTGGQPDQQKDESVSHQESDMPPDNTQKRTCDNCSDANCAGCQPPNNKWVCEACTLHNEIDIDVCCACGSRSPTKKAGIKKKQDNQPKEWTCSTCTLSNPIENSKCDICDTSSPTKKGEWACGTCTTLNPLSSVKCKSCSEPAPPSVRLLNESKQVGTNRSASPDQPDWICQQCSYKNEGINSSCSMCEMTSPKWVCRNCTFENNEGIQKCTLCPDPQPERVADASFARRLEEENRVEEERRQLIEARDAILAFELLQKIEAEDRLAQENDFLLAEVMAQEDGAIQKECRICKTSCCVPKSYKDKPGVCLKDDCQQLYPLFCSSYLECGHPCSGIHDEETHAPCTTCNPEEDCYICAEPSNSFPSILLTCGHYTHKACMQSSIKNAVTCIPGTKIDVKARMLQCPVCFQWIEHKSLETDDKRKLIDRMTEIGRSFYEKDPEQKKNPIKSKDLTFADVTKEYSYYCCHDCQSPFVGGRNDCEVAQEENEDNAKPDKRVLCNNCIVDDTGRGKVCNKHPDQLLIKCDFCCDFALYHCFGGKDHFCESCHSTVSREVFPCIGPECKLGGNHPKGRTHRYIVGCAGCRNDVKNPFGGRK
eukprot:TRINITY_DN10450_c0_g1_i2.p1 TRINITY_DN10450_c0_g1~~TRINITY_DN10450_c0_g1_i2.p1  ORF type:complete len:1014 (+),score=204.15 TRINITY_DN10450_c0_g1_i2:84-3125(+)